LRFVVPLVEMPVYLPWLAEQVRADGAEWHQRRIDSLTELADDGVDAIVNCSGLGARDLVGDGSVYPVRGQIVRVTNPGLTMSVRDENHPAGRAYVHPRVHDCILGGTLDVGSWDTRVDLETSASILRRCRDIVPALAEATVIEHVVGLRPGRPVVCLEEDVVDDSGPRILHNYGHGGAGVTIGWGCAEEISRLLGPGRP
jgi:D-amino-acid oxidase